MCKPIIPANLPADALGFVCVRPDRSERLAFYTAEGVLNTTFAMCETLDDIRPRFFAAGYSLTAEGFVTLRGEG